MTTPSHARIAITYIGISFLALGYIGLLFTQHKDRNISGHTILFAGTFFNFFADMFKNSVPGFLTNSFNILGNILMALGSLAITNSAMNNAEKNGHLPYAITAIIIGGITAYINRDIFYSSHTNVDENTVPFPTPKKPLLLQSIAPLPEVIQYAPAA